MGQEQIEEEIKKMPNFGDRVRLVRRSSPMVIMRDGKGKGEFWGFGHSVCPELREGEVGMALMVPHG